MDNSIALSPRGKMEIFAVIFIIVLTLPVILVLFDFFKYVFTGKRAFRPVFNRILEAATVAGLPLFFLQAFDYGFENDCCTTSATFSPEHRLTIYAWIIVCMVAFFISTYKKRIAPPLVEAILNAMLLIGIFLNILIGYHAEQPLWLWGNLPVGLLFIIILMENQKKLIQYAREKDLSGDTFLTRMAWKVLALNPILQIPILLLLCLPVITVMTAILLLFGQKPDAAVRAFTETYRHGFSQLDHLCRNVDCGGHFLCSVAAKGHREVVKPERPGIRGGGLIICNRQLLVANAFEELLAERLPGAHRVIRRNYDKVGALVHKYYAVFENKYVCDAVYLAMKPAEWLFLLALYSFDREPERRVGRQYLDRTGRMWPQN